MTRYALAMFFALFSAAFGAVMSNFDRSTDSAAMRMSAAMRSMVVFIGDFLRGWLFLAIQCYHGGNRRPVRALGVV